MPIEIVIKQKKRQKNIFFRYLINVLVSIDQLINTIFGGDPDETISSRLGKNYPKSFLTKTVNFIFFWDNGIHCEKYIEEDEGKKAIFK